jgi:gamma-butyrobetaine dioxygenase
MSHVVRVMDVRVETGAVEIDFDDGRSGRFHPVWLRDTCQCNGCRHPNTLRRVDESMQIPVDMITESIELSADRTELSITWPDGHDTTVATGWLARHATAGSAGTLDATTIDRAQGKLTWGAEIADRLPWAEYADVTSDPVALLTWLETIDRSGFALLRGMPTDRITMTELAHRIGPIRASNYGVDWEIEATNKPRSAVYSARRLSAHSDLPYRQAPPGLQFLLSDVADAPGGESMLVDGYRVAEQLRIDHPDFWETLTETDVSFTYVDDDFDLRYQAPIIGLDRGGSYGVIRHAPGLLSPFDPRPELFGPLYAAVHRFTQMLADPAYEVRLRLEPGQLVAFDNVRVLHGRAAFDLGPGRRRHLLGCYVDADDLHSTIRVLRRNQG